MQEIENQEIIQVLYVFYQALRKHGVEPILEKFRQLDTEDLKTEMIIKFILENSSKLYDVPIEKIVSADRGNAAVCRKMCFILLKNNTPLSDKRIGNVFGGRSRTVIWKAISEFHEMRKSAKVRSEHEFLNNYVTLNKQVVEYKEYIKSEFDTKNQDLTAKFKKKYNDLNRSANG